MRLDIVTPEKQILSEEVERVMLPGMDGDMTILGDHAPMVTTLRPGLISVEGGSAAGDYVVTGGFAEISSAGTSILAEQATPKADSTTEMLEASLEEAREALEKAPDGDKAMAALRVNDLTVLLSQHGS